MTPKHTRSTGRRERGSVLVLGLIVLLVITGLAAAFMEAGLSESSYRTNSAHRARALYIAEAGANRGVANLLQGGDGNLGSVESPLSFGGGEYRVETTDHGDGSFTILSIGHVSGQRRAIEVVLAPEEQSLYKHALFGDLDLQANGNVFVDSYDSELGTYASQAVNTHPETGDTYAKANGSLGSNADIAISGSVTVLGDANPGPGHTVSISGSSTYISGSTEPSPTTRPLPPVEYNPPIASSGDCPTSSDLILSDGVYHYDNLTLSGKKTITIQGDVTLYVDDQFKISGQGQITIDPDSSLEIYHDGDDFDLTGGGVLNSTQLPGALHIFSTAETVKFAGNSGFYGTVYAPDAAVTPTGTSAVYGSVLGKQITISGTADFHYDEALARAEDSISTLKTVSWRRVAAPVN